MFLFRSTAGGFNETPRFIEGTRGVPEQQFFLFRSTAGDLNETPRFIKGTGGNTACATVFAFFKYLCFVREIHYFMPCKVVLYL